MSTIISFQFHHQIKSFERPMTDYRLEIPDETTFKRGVYSTCCVESEMIRYISWGTIFESWDRVCETTAPAPCVSGIGTGHSNASAGQESPYPSNQSQANPVLKISSPTLIEGGEVNNVSNGGRSRQCLTRMSWGAWNRKSNWDNLRQSGKQTFELSKNLIKLDSGLTF